MAGISIERWYDQHAQAMFAFTLNYTRNESDTRDIIQQIFVKLATRPDLVESVREERSFLLRLCANGAIDLIRRRGTRERNYAEWVECTSIFAESPNPDVETFRNALTAALGELPAEQRSVVHLRLWEGMTFERIAEVLDISVNTVGSRYRYGIDKLRDLLRPVYEEIK
jgi:RNA polymerase sigma-70 factor (ECF subfamily)